ncbi:N-acetylglucosamine-6-phosphate deacetylase [Thermosipho atlanticus]|uniref:N-acetylglucosamine 6-phosphate deacetylase n=1 Tax=Thermosipho atlanticus DSM 15807 TaxID=1123380 RepID=A0A1M5TNF2_9BACT|nr:N-acetylglucosamine-6-phosphate deacetylase [Thermosipho atlanticus]SHH52200.1 N-acetylglucosamine 6-phosphate deacetylase [Thermosipho atlanticus DSM 15807]
MVIERVLIVDPIDGEYCGSVVIENGVIVDIIKNNSAPRYIVMPGFVDSHSHGKAGIDCMTASSLEFENWAEHVRTEGVTYLFPTTVSSSKKSLENVVANFSKANHPVLNFLHFEGPFINIERSGAQNKKYITSFSKDRLPEVKDKVKIITAAPEVEKFNELIKFAKKENIVISLGHSNGTFKDFKESFEKGINRVPHFPNALKRFHHRDVGPIGAVFLYKFYVELIVDNMHLSNEFLKLVYNILGPKRIMLVTDSIPAAGLEDGIYNLGEMNVKVKNGVARLENGSLAGSTLKYIEGVKNFRKATNCSLKELSMVTSYNSLKLLGIKGGRIRRGYPAKIVILDEDLNVKKTIV